MKILRTILVDDDPRCIQLLSEYLRSGTAGIDVVATADTPNEGIKKIRSEQPDLVFLDISMPGLTGFDVLDQCAPRSFEAVIVSAHEKYALQAFRHHAFHYLLKPFTEEEVMETVKRIARSGSGQNTEDSALKEWCRPLNSRISIGTTEGIHILAVRDIMRCEADGSYTNVFLKNGDKVMASHSIKFFEKQLESHGFLRVHKSHLVNLEEIEFVDHTGGVYLRKCSLRIQVALRRRKELMQSLIGC